MADIKIVLDDGELKEWIIGKLTALEDRIMAELDDIKVALAAAKDSLTTVSGNLANIANDQAGLVQQITDLQARLVNGTIVSNADLVDLKTKAQDLQTGLASMAASSQSVADAIPG